MSRPVLLLLAALAATLAAACPAAARAPRTGRCLPDGTGPRCHFWYGKVTSINDGDTVRVDIDGDGSHRTPAVRFTNIQAMELSVHSPHPERRRGQCNAIEATTRLEQLIRRSHRRVRLSAQYASSRADVRLQRNVAVRLHGRWRDTGLMLIREGHALWMATLPEDAWNQRYARAEQLARLDGRFLWDSTHCGAGPAQDATLKVWALWDPPGIDSDNVAGEWLKVANPAHAAPVSLTGWWVRDSMQRRYTFGPGTTLAPGRTLTLHTGHGADSGLNRYWGLGQPLFQNAGGTGRHLGDGVYLFDPQGDLRAASVYPCVVGCVDRLQATLTITAHPRQPEGVSITNVSDAPVGLDGYALTVPGAMYAFPPDSIVPAHGTLRVAMQGTPAADTPTNKHWGMNRHMLPDVGGAAAVKTFTDITIACDAWGGGRC